MTLSKLLLSLALSVVVSIFALGQTTLKVAISKGIPKDVFINYYNFIHTVDSTVELVDLYGLPLDSAMLVLNSCDGLLLTGGTDIYPGIYGKESDTTICWEPDHKRDSLEFAALTKATSLNIPVLGICRGMQLMNVHFGGTLHTDIPTDLGLSTIHQKPDTYNCPHQMNIVSGSFLQTIAGVSIGETNSNHHQGIEQLADNLTPMAKTNDGLIESIQNENYIFVMGVQWHPERMSFDNPLSGNIAKTFISYCRQSQ